MDVFVFMTGKGYLLQLLLEAQKLFAGSDSLPCKVLKV